MERVTNILCPIDFSEFSRHAFDRALAIAREHGGAITVLHVEPFRTSPLVPYLASGNVGPLLYSETERGLIVEQMRQFLSTPEPRGVTIEYQFVEGPSVHGEILQQADRLQADFIVMGTHGRSGFQHLLLGSVAEKVVRTARCPVLTLGAVPTGTAAGGSSFKRILCATDFSECSIAALRYGVSLAEESNAAIKALYVVEWAPLGYDPLVGPAIDLEGYRQLAETSGHERLHDTALAAAGTRKIEEMVTSGRPYLEILKVASDWNADLIVIGIDGRKNKMRR